MTGRAAGCSARHNRPRRRAAEQGDELAPSHEVALGRGPHSSTSFDNGGRAMHRSEIFGLKTGLGQNPKSRSKIAESAFASCGHAICISYAEPLPLDVLVCKRKAAR
jgi:hypothetical protein